jgi:hypothetical protein
MMNFSPSSKTSDYAACHSLSSQSTAWSIHIIRHNPICGIMALMPRAA